MTVKKLLNYKKKSEFLIENLMNENTLKTRKTGKNVNADNINETNKTINIEDHNALKSEFYKFKPIQRNQLTNILKLTSLETG